MAVTCPRFARTAAPFRLRAALRDASFAATILLAVSAILAAEEVAHDRTQIWMPAVLHLPSDAEISFDREVGSTTRMFSILTEQDADVLFADWEEALRLDGYSIDQGADEVLERSIEFSSEGIANAKVVAAPVAAEGRTVVEFDATLQ